MRNLKFIEISGESCFVCKAFLLVLKQNKGKVISCDDAIGLFRNNELAHELNYGGKKGFSVICNFGEIKGCLIKVSPIIFENKEIGALIYVKDKCQLIDEEQFRCYKTMNEQQSAVFSFSM